MAKAGEETEKPSHSLQCDRPGESPYDFSWMLQCCPLPPQCTPRARQVFNLQKQSVTYGLITGLPSPSTSELPSQPVILSSPWHSCSYFDTSLMVAPRHAQRLQLTEFTCRGRGLHRRLPRSGLLPFPQIASLTDGELE